MNVRKLTRLATILLVPAALHAQSGNNTISGPGASELLRWPW